jgi:starch synthase
MRESMTTTTEPAIALLHWGNVWEDFLDSIGVSFEAFCKEMTGCITDALSYSAKD